MRDGGEFDDDFESSTLLRTEIPPGMWDTKDVPAEQTLAPGPAAAHRGDAGLELLDRLSAAGSGSEGRIQLRHPPRTGDLYLRVWIRVYASNDAGAINVLSIDGRVLGIVDLQLKLDDGTLSVGTRQAGDVYRAQTFPLTVEPPGWHLVELAATGSGGTTGSVSLWINGLRLYSRTPQDFSDADRALHGVSLGETFSADRRFVGDLHFDDVRVSAQPLASRFTLEEVSAPEPHLAGDCVPLQLTLRDVTLTRAVAAPYVVDAQLTLSSDAGVEAYSDSACLSGLTAASMSSSATTLYVKASGPGGATVSAASVDFLPSQPLTLTFGPRSEEPTPLGPAHYPVACGCASHDAGGGGTWLLLALALATLRGPSRTSSPVRRGLRWARRSGQTPRTSARA